MQIWIECGIVFLVAIAATIAFNPFAKRLARRCDAIDYPDNRRVNTRPIPRMGGVAMFCGLTIACIVAALGSILFGWVNPLSNQSGENINFTLVCIGMAFMFLVGFVDDIINLRARYKFIGQIIAASIVAASGLLLQNIQNPFASGSFIEFGWLAYPITVLYLVCFANVINLIDGLDGLASGISAISAATIFAFSVFAGRPDAAILCAAVVGICVGFLRYNHYPASIFMGDSGSLLLGLGLGVVSLLAVARSTLIISLLVPLMAAGVPIMDTAAAIIRRKRAHQPIDSPDTGHIHHRLLAAGYTQNFTVLIMWAWTAMLAICGIVLAESEGPLRIAVIVLAAVVTGIAIYKLKLLDPVLRHYYNPRRKPSSRAGENAPRRKTKRRDGADRPKQTPRQFVDQSPRSRDISSRSRDAGNRTRN